MAPPPLAARVAAETAYAPGRRRQPIDLHLDANECPPLPGLMERACLRVDPSRYPDAGPLEAAIAAKLTVDADRVVVTAGADDALLRLCQSLLEPGRTAVLTTPSFEMIGRYARLAGAEVRSVAWATGAFPVDELASHAGPGTGAIFIVSPNNPTGACITAEELVELRAATGAVPIVLDAAYAEFGGADVAGIAQDLANLHIVRTFSKAWGLAGLRVGYAVTDPRSARALRAAGNPYPVSALSLAAASLALEEYRSALRERADRIAVERAMLAERLHRLGACPFPSAANFVLARFRNARLTADLLAGVGIAVRRFDIGSGIDGCLRVTCPGSRRGFDRLVRSLDTALAPGVLLLDGRLGGAAEVDLRGSRLPMRRIDPTPEMLRNAAAAGERPWLITGEAGAIGPARSAGVPVLAISPGAAPRHADSLLAAGAARVLPSARDILELLP